jgi:hypothetical protein
MQIISVRPMMAHLENHLKIANPIIRKDKQHFQTQRRYPP